MAVSVSIAAILGIAGAWAGSVLRSSGRAGRLMAALLAACMVFAVALPLVLHAGAWESTAGKFGWLMLTQTGARAEGTGPYGMFAGLIAAGWIHAMYGAAIVGLATWHGTSKTPAQIVQQSDLDLSPSAAWWRVRLAIAAPWVSLGLLLTGLLAATEMTVVNLYGFRTLADQFYLFYAVDPSLGPVLMTCALPLAMAASLIGRLLVARRRSITTQLDGGPPHPDSPREFPSPRESYTQNERFPKAQVALAIAVCLAWILVVVAVPLTGLAMKLGHDVTVVGDDVQASWSADASLRRLVSAPREFGAEYQWTAMIAALSGLTALLIAMPLAIVGRNSPRWEPWIDGMAVVCFVIPGPIVGLVVVSLFQLRVPGFNQLYQQTLIPTVMALMLRAVPVAYWVLRSAYRSVADAIFDASRLDTWPLRRFWQVHRPLLARRWMAAGLAAGLVAAGDVPAMLPVLPPGVSTVGTRLFGLLHSGARYQEAALAIWYVIAVLAISSFFIRQPIALRVK